MAPVNRAAASRIAAAVTCLRPEWPPASTVTLLLDPENHTAKRPWQDVAVALVYVACDPDSKSPARVLEPGPWWQIGQHRDREGRKAERHDRKWHDRDRPCGGVHYRGAPCDPERPASNLAEHLEAARAAIAEARASFEVDA